jgi:hypothetical protein
VTAQRRSLPMLRIIAVLAALAVLGGAYGIWYLFFRPSGPAPVGSSDLPISSLSSAPAPASADGTWKVDTSIGSFADSTSSFVGYRVQEQLAGIGPNTAVGRTPNVSGTLTLSGTTVTAVEVTGRPHNPAERRRPPRQLAAAPSPRDEPLPDRDLQADRPDPARIAPG